MKGEKSRGWGGGGECVKKKEKIKVEKKIPKITRNAI